MFGIRWRTFRLRGEALGYAPTVWFEEGLSRTVAWYRENFCV